MFNTPSFFEYRRCFTAPKSSPTLLPFNHADEDGSFSGVVNSQTGEITNLSKTGTQEQGEIERVAQDRINAIRPLANNISNTQEEKFRNQQEQIQILTSEIVSLKSEHRILKKRLSKKSKSDPKGIKKITDQIEKEDHEKQGVIES